MNDVINVTRKIQTARVGNVAFDFNYPFLQETLKSLRNGNTEKSSEMYNNQDTPPDCRLDGLDGWRHCIQTKYLVAPFADSLKIISEPAIFKFQVTLGIRISFNDLAKTFQVQTFSKYRNDWRIAIKTHFNSEELEKLKLQIFDGSPIHCSALP